MAKILLSLSDESRIKRATEALSGGRHDLVPLPLTGTQPENVPEAASAIYEAHGDLIILDYWPSDAASVKLMQTVSDLATFERPAFIFIESPGLEASREEIIMTLNEGAQAFLPADFQPAALINYVERATMGPGRMRPRARDSHDCDGSLHVLEEALGHARTQSQGLRKLVGHLLATPVSVQNRKVLLVSDSPYQLDMLKKILEDHNFQVMTASNPNDALNAALSDNPRIIVSDLELEGQNGVEFCRAVKFTHKIIPCFFVICTANQKKIDKVMSPGNGVDDCLLKPSGPHDTLEFVARVAMGLLL
jgi:DNA-binding response OmpR family regulator